MRPQENHGKGVLRLFDSQNTIKVANVPDLVDMLVKVGLLSSELTIRKVLCSPMQMNEIDCGVYACVYIRNMLWGYSERMADSKSQEWRRSIYESIFLGRDVKRPMEHIVKLNNPKDLQGEPVQSMLFCSKCVEHFRDITVKLKHDKYLHRKVRQCRVCRIDIKFAEAAVHETKCREKELKRIYSIRDDEFLRLQLL